MIGYARFMALLAPALASLIASSVPAADAVRFDPAAATVTVSARIIASSARVGAGLAPPRPRMVPRRATVSAADGQPVAALIYDFE